MLSLGLPTIFIRFNPIHFILMLEIESVLNTKIKTLLNLINDLNFIK